VFTGLIQQVGSVQAWNTTPGRRQLTVAHAAWDTPLVTGESVAVSGVCLTVESHADTHFECTMLDETYRRGAFAERPVGAPVNLERALAVGDRLGGHIVQGHVDGCAPVEHVSRDGNDWVIRVAGDNALLEGIVAKGSVAIDGVSLTVAAVDNTGFEVRIIPHTWTETTLHALSTGSIVAVELDILGKYARKAAGLPSRGVDEDTLRRAGFI